MKTYHIILAVLGAILLGVTASPFPVLPLVFLVLLAFKLSALRYTPAPGAAPFGLQISWTAVLAPVWVPIVADIVIAKITGAVASQLFPTILQLLQSLGGKQA